MNIGPFMAHLEHWHYNTFVAIPHDTWAREQVLTDGNWLLHFRIDEEGKIEGVEFLKRLFYHQPDKTEKSNGTMSQ